MVFSPEGFVPTGGFSSGGKCNSETRAQRLHSAMVKFDAACTFLITTV